MLTKENRLACPEARIESTSLCNAKCIICPRDKMTRPEVTMPMGHFARIIDQVKELGATTVSVFGYGEPLMDDGLAQKIQYCTAQGIKTLITTNAALLDPNFAFDLIEAGLSQIRFSVHGLTKKNYERVHRKLDYDLVIRNISNFIAINRMKKAPVITDVIAIPMNGESVEDIKNRWGEHVDYLEVWRPHNWVNAKTYRKVEQKKKTCGRPFRGPIQVNADGTMMVCCFDFDSQLTIGDTYKDNIKDILLGPAMRIIQAVHSNGDLGSLICGGCDQLNEEKESPLLYSDRDKELRVGRTSVTKFKLGGK